MMKSLKQFHKTILPLVLLILFPVLTFSYQDSDRDGIADSRDRCPGAREVFNDVIDSDGCPDTLFMGIFASIVSSKTGEKIAKPGKAFITGRKGNKKVIKIENGTFSFVTATPGEYNIDVRINQCKTEPVRVYLANSQFVNMKIKVSCPSSEE